MNTKIFIIILSAVLFMAATVRGERSTFIAVSPFLSDAEKLEVRTALLKHILQGAKAGDRIAIADGWSGNVEARFIVPALKYDSIRGRRTPLRDALSQLVIWFDKTPPVKELAGSGALDTSALIGVIEKEPAESVVLLIGSGIYRSPVDDAHNWYRESGEFKGHWYPSDGAFFAVQGETPWVVHEGRNRLGKARVHWLLKGQPVTFTGRYAEAVRRFYSLYVQLEGGALVSFHGDMGQVFADLHRKDLKPRADAVDRSSRDLMLRVNPPKLVWD